MHCKECEKDCIGCEWRDYVADHIYGIPRDDLIMMIISSEADARHNIIWKEASQEIDKKSCSDEELVRAYGKTQHSWSIATAPNKMGFVNWINRNLSGKKTSSLLDIGCGIGDLTCFFPYSHRIEGKVVGIDGSEIPLATAKKIAESARVPVEFKNCSASALPFDKDEFEVVFHKDVLHWQKDWWKSLCETTRVLSSGGILFLQYQPDSSFRRCEAEPSIVVGRLKLAGMNVPNQPEITDTVSRSRIVRILAIKE